MFGRQISGNQFDKVCSVSGVSQEDRAEGGGPELLEYFLCVCD